MKKGYTQAEFADLLGVSKRTIEQWEAGNRTPTKCTYMGIQLILEEDGTTAEVMTTPPEWAIEIMKKDFCITPQPGTAPEPEPETAPEPQPAEIPETPKGANHYYEATLRGLGALVDAAKEDEYWLMELAEQIAAVANEIKSNACY